MGLIYLKLELKRALKKLPYVLAGAVLLFLLTGLIALLAVRSLYGDSAVGRIRVGVSLPEEDGVAKQVVRLLSSMESVESVCDFEYMGFDEALEDMGKGELFAVLQVPERFVQGIINGENIPVTVWLPKDAALEGKLFAALADAGAATLSASQAGIYAGNELYQMSGAADRIPQLEADLNRYYLSFSLARMDDFRRMIVSGTGDAELSDFYMISAYVLFLFLVCVPAGEYLLPPSGTMKMRLDAAGMKGGRRALCRIAGVTMLLMIVSLPVIAGAVFWGKLRLTPLLFLCLLLSCMAAAVFAVLCYSIAGTLLGGLLLLFPVTAAQHFMAGGFLPKVFLPISMQAAADWLPSGMLMNLLQSAMTGRAEPKGLLSVVVMILAGTAADMLFERRRP